MADHVPVQEVVGVAVYETCSVCGAKRMISKSVTQKWQRKKPGQHGGDAKRAWEEVPECLDRKSEVLKTG